MTRRGFFRRAAGVGVATATTIVAAGPDVEAGSAGVTIDNDRVEFRGGQSGVRGQGGAVEVYGSAIVAGVYFENMVVPADTRVIFERVKETG